jgi:V8-like Glu-specific endopeptidase
MKNLVLRTIILLLLSAPLGLFAQKAASVYPVVEPNQFDYGKMWTFEHAPMKYFTDTYGFKPDERWFSRVRMAALRFSSYCSASFISPDGLVMTNHHCSRGEVGKVMKEGDDFDKNGFYAATQEEERRVEGLFVKQLVQIEDVTDAVTALTSQAKSDQEIIMLRDSAVRMLKKEYSAKPNWDGLEIEQVLYYNGGRVSLYGYKRYDDVRLVWIPELQLGFFGGDYDNFTFPRYNLDCTFWRVYENGKPVNSRNFYFPFNPDGIKEGEPVFVVGNPGSTERYRTVAQLEYDRDYRYNIQLAWMKNREAILKEEYNRNPSHDLQEQLFSMANGIKAINGIVEGMHDPILMGRKQGMENKVKAQSKAVASGQDYWKQLADEYAPLYAHASEITLLGPSPLSGSALLLMHYSNAYEKALEGGAGEEDLKALREQLKATAAGLKDPQELRMLTTLLEELKTYASSDDAYLTTILDGRTPLEAARRILDKTDFADTAKLSKLMELKADKYKKDKDPLLVAGRLIVPAFENAVKAFRSSTPKRKAIEGKIGQEIYQVFGLNIPPDATFTLRISDGVVKPYEYNGTMSPVQTTYFGFYDRYYSYGGKFPWSLPERWQNPPMELLKAPFNFVSTNDIIGGNSGSPMINAKGEAVGLVFDGNIESLPGNFIYDTQYNRAVSVHAGGIAAALKYMFKADRLVKELGL